MLATCANGFMNLAQFSVAYEMAVFQVRSMGIGEATVCGCINTGANAIGFILVMSLTPSLGGKGIWVASGVFAGMLALSLVSMMIVRMK